MKTVFLIRHAKSSWDDPDLRDFERPLNKRGLRDAPFMAKVLHARGVTPDGMVASPARRTWSTALFFAREMGLPEASLIREPRLYEAGPETLREVIRHLNPAWSAVFLVGHNPGLTELANHFLREYLANIPTCGIVRIDDPVDSWAEFGSSEARMTEFHYPKQYFSKKNS